MATRWETEKGHSRSTNTGAWRNGRLKCSPPASPPYQKHIPDNLAKIFLNLSSKQRHRLAPGSRNGSKRGWRKRTPSVHNLRMRMRMFGEEQESHHQVIMAGGTDITLYIHLHSSRRRRGGRFASSTDSECFDCVVCASANCFHLAHKILRLVMNKSYS